MTDIIVKAEDPEKVIPLGNHATGRWVEDRFTEGHITYKYVSDYHILVNNQPSPGTKEKTMKSRVL